jgi:hypothetical protein
MNMINSMRERAQRMGFDISSMRERAASMGFDISKMGGMGAGSSLTSSCISSILSC